MSFSLAMAAITLAGSFGIAGCGEITPIQAKADREEPTYRTGSNLAERQRANRRLGVQTMTGEEFERARIPSMPAPMPAGGH